MPEDPSPPRPSLAPALRRGAAWLAEAAAVAAIGVWAVSWVAPRAALRPDQVSLLPLESVPGDANGTIWYWYWYREAWARGVPVTVADVLCAPGGLELRQSFPGSVDAAFALPFFSWLPMPAALNWTLLAIPVAALVCAWALFRAVFAGAVSAETVSAETVSAGAGFAGGARVVTLEDRAAAFAVSLAAASWSGAQGYVFAEIRAGRPVTAMVFLLPLYLLALRGALTATGVRGAAWALAAGWAASLVARAYAPFALALLAISLAAGGWYRATRSRGPQNETYRVGETVGGGHLSSSALTRGHHQPVSATLYVARPAPGVGRGRPLAAGLVIGAAGLWLCLPWLHELWVIRGLGPAGLLPGPRPTPAELWEPRLYADLWAYLQIPARQAPGRPEAFHMLIRGVQEQAMPVDWLWRIAPGEPGRRAWISRASLVAAGAGVILGGARGRRWGLLAAGLLLLIAGPQAATDVSTGHVRYWEPWGGPIRLPLAWLLEAAPGLSPYLKPYRAAPLLVLALGGAWVAGAARAWAWARDRSVAVRRASLAAIWAISAGLATWNIYELSALNYLKLHEHPWSVPSILSRLDAVDADPSRPAPILVELPAGIGHATAWLQPIHRMRRSEGHPDQIQRLRQTAAHPDQCYRTAFLRAIWYLDRGPGLPGGAMESAVAAGLAAGAVAEARGQGVRYVLLYPGLYDLYRREGVAADMGLAVARLRAALGAPVYEGADAILWDLGD